MDSIEPPSSKVIFLLFTPFVLLTVSFGGISIGIILIILMLACSALISGAEVAYFSLSPSDLHLLANEGSVNSKRILQLRDSPRILLATILISNNFVNIAIVILSDFLIRNIFPMTTFFEWAEGMPALILENFFVGGYCKGY
ncbi:MAG: DUF21 domain-containing protein [Saprospiraceae bacterium]|nr:DUF21 domain-containing protein [Saprospiraceae bacterium]